MMHCNFGPASPDEGIVYGACRPGYHSNAPLADAVEEWIAEMRAQDIERVCCLLDDGLRAYDDLLGTYRTTFGGQNICHAPIEEFGVVSAEMLHGEILPFLREANNRGEKVVVHCAAGSGRTGQVLVLWLMHERGYEREDAIRAVKRTGRRPLEAATWEQLDAL